MWVWCKNIYNENLAPQWRSNSNSTAQFFTKMGKMPDMGFETPYKDGLCPKLEKNPAKPKLSPQNVLHDTPCPLLSNSIVLEFVIFY